MRAGSLTISDRQLSALHEIAVGVVSWDLMAEREQLAKLGLLEARGARWSLTVQGRRLLSVWAPAERETLTSAPVETGSKAAAVRERRPTGPRLHLDGKTRAGLLEGRISKVIREPNGTTISVGDVLPVMPASGPAVFRVEVVWPEFVSLAVAIPDGDVKRARDLGHRTSADARRAWLAVADRRLRQLSNEDRDQLDDEAWDDAWARHQDRRVWLLAVTVDESEGSPRFLGRGTADRTALLTNDGAKKRVSDGGDIARGYVSSGANAVSGAECVSDADLARFRLEADEREIALLEERLAQVRGLLSEFRGGQFENDIRVIEQRLDRMRHRYERSRSAA